MEDRLKKLKSSLDQHVFNQISFSQERRQATIEFIKSERLVSQEQIALALISIINGRVMTGGEMINTLLEKKNTTFNDHEGSLYTILHKLESKGILYSGWRLNQNNKQRKYYSITFKGKLIAFYSKSTRAKAISLVQDILNGGNVYEQKSIKHTFLSI